MRKHLLLLVITGLVMVFWGISVAQEGAEAEPPPESTTAVESTEAGQTLDPVPMEPGEEESIAEIPIAAGLTLAEESDEFPLPVPVQVEVIDANNDDGTALGVIWAWGATEIKLAAPEDVLKACLAVNDPAWALIEQNAELLAEGATTYSATSQAEKIAEVRAILDVGKKATKDELTTYSLQPNDLDLLLAGFTDLRDGLALLMGEYASAYQAVGTGSRGSLPDEMVPARDFEAVLAELDLLIERVAKYADVFWKAQVAIEVKVKPDLSEPFVLTPEEETRRTEARAALVDDVASLLPEQERLQAAVDAVQIELMAKTVDQDPVVHELRAQYWQEKRALNKINIQIEKARKRYDSRVTRSSETLHEKFWSYTLTQAAVDNLEWAASNISGRADSFKTVGDHDHQFGLHPENADLNYVQVESMVLRNPAMYGSPVVEDGDIGERQTTQTQVDLIADEPYELRIIVARGGLGLVAAQAELDNAVVGTEAHEAAQAKLDALSAKFILSAPMLYAMQVGPVDGVRMSPPVAVAAVAPKVQYFDTALINNLVFAVLFGLVIMSAIMLARRNPNLFIRRIAGLEAVDEAIGRATEMGKPVLYLCGLDSLATLSTLAAINILGRVARRVADYDSDLLVPCRDPIVLTVAQEVTHEAYIDQGRPDAYKEDNIFFVTDDQFSYTATTCAIMMREKPAANFFMGYYYAESLLLAETGAATGAIQIAGTDALAQLPFFITTCDYTLIGEELYAASAYLSREPMLLGSLKGQDVGKAAVMILIILQTILFLINDNWLWFKEMVTPR